MKKKLAALLMLALLLSCLSCTALAVDMTMEIQCPKCYTSWECTIVSGRPLGPDTHTLHLKCNTCSSTFTITGNHDYEGYEFGTSTGICRLCDYHCPHPTDSVAEANCISPKRCGLCNMVLEDGVDLTNHADEFGYEPYNAYEHHFVWICCKMEIEAPAPHRWVDGQCCDCGYWCKHPGWSDGVCVICGDECPHESYTAGVCDACGSFCPSSGDNATCLTAANCEACGTSHINPSKHEGTLAWVQTATAHRQVWSCCKAVENEGEHSWDQNGLCTTCEYQCLHDFDEETDTCSICQFHCDHSTSDVDEAVEPSCTEMGRTAGSHCAVCAKALVAQEVIPALGHEVGFEAAVYEAETGGEAIAIQAQLLCGHSDALRFVPSKELELVDSSGLSGSFAGVSCGVAEVTMESESGIPARGSCTVIVHSASRMILPESLSQIGEEAFAGMPAQEFVLPDTVETIESKAFAGCSSLLLINLPDGVRIADDAFADCERLTIICTENSSAQAYAEAHDMAYVIH